MKRKQSLKLSISFKENLRDLEIYNFLNEVIKDEIGISTYIKMLISEDMKKRNAYLKSHRMAVRMAQNSVN